MKRHGHKRTWRAISSSAAFVRPALLSAVLFGAYPCALRGQVDTAPAVSQQIQQLTDAMARAQAQIQESQHQLDAMRAQLIKLQDQMATQNANAASATGPSQATVPQGTAAPSASDIEEIRERQAMQQAQVATQEQTKVESESKYPVKVTGLLLLNGFVNTGGVDMPSTPTLAIPGNGSTGATVRQTVLGLDAFGPHLFGAHSYASLRVDFDGVQSSGSTMTGYTGYTNTNATLLRLRTAHAGLRWDHTEAYFALDRPIISPDSPTSLAATAEPALAWSGNLWSWNSQLGLTHNIGLGARSIRLQSALIDTGSAPASAAAVAAAPIPATDAERSRWPGIEARVALLGSATREDASHIGVGGYFAPHTSLIGRRYDSWSASVDTRLNLPVHLSLTTFFYRGLGLGGLGGGSYKDYGLRPDANKGTYYFRPLDAIGGWAQLKETINQRVEMNAAFGLDETFSGQLRPFFVPGASAYQNLARNRSFTGNVIFSPSAYLLFSLEYRRLESAPVTGPAAETNILGIAAAYKF